MKKTSREKLFEAAVELLSKQGYDNTTVQQIAERAGLTERTFFRLFKDKADILFAGGESYSEMVLAAMGNSKATNPVEIVLDGYAFAASWFDDNAERSRKRQAIIQSHPDLQERELLKQVKVEGLLQTYLSEQFNFDEATIKLAVRLARGVYSTAWEEWLANEASSCSDRLKSAVQKYKDLTKA